VRVLTGLALLAAFTAAMLIDVLTQAAWPALVVGTLLIAAAVHEFFVMARKIGAAPFTLPGVIAGALAFNLPWIMKYHPYDYDVGTLLAALAIVAFAGVVCRKSRQNAPTDVAVTIFGVVYIGLLSSYLVQIHLPENGAKLVIYFVAVAKSADIGGYLTGKFVGRHKLAPKISPKKTLEGSAGGILLSIVAAFALSSLLPGPFSPSWKILFALLVNIAAQFGDLTESVMKRSCNVKDSAVILPKVCGALDLIDSILLSAPVGCYLITVAW